MSKATFRSFSTPKYDGIGHGLAMCRSIAAAYNGSISIGNRDDGTGAIVQIRSPHPDCWVDEQTELVA
jgi:C4-dicarboxylate-specific signal transduction histidine kinase